jgi:hypothetical protein
MVHGIPWNSRGAGSSPTCGSQAFCAGEIVGESGCGGWFQFVIRQSLAAGLATRRGANATAQTSPRARAEVVAPGAAEIAEGTAAGFAALGLRTGRVVCTACAGFDSAAVCRGLSSRLRRNALASARLEFAETRATRSRIERWPQLKKVASAESMGKNGTLWRCDGWIFSGMARAFPVVFEKGCPGEVSRQDSRTSGRSSATRSPSRWTSWSQAAPAIPWTRPFINR